MHDGRPLPSLDTAAAVPDGIEISASPTMASPVDWAMSDSPVDDGDSFGLGTSGGGVKGGHRGEMQSDAPQISANGNQTSASGGGSPKRSKPTTSSLLCPPATIVSPPSPVDPKDDMARFETPELVQKGWTEGSHSLANDGSREDTGDVFASGHFHREGGQGKDEHGEGKVSSPGRSPRRPPSPVPLAATHMSNSPKFMSPSRRGGSLPAEEIETPGSERGHSFADISPGDKGTNTTSTPSHHRGHTHRDSLVPPPPSGSRDYFSSAYGSISASASASTSISPSPSQPGTPSQGLIPTPLSPRSPTPSSPGFHPKRVGHRRLSSTHRVRESKGEQRSSEDGERMVNQYKFVRELGKGMFAKVELAVDVGTGDEYAVKEFSQSRLHTQSLQEKHRAAARGRAFNRGRGGRPAAATTALRDPALESPEFAPNNETDRQKEEETMERSKEDPLALIRREIAVMKKLDHPNIVHLYEAIAVRSADALFLILEFMPGGVLMDVHLGTQPKEPPFPVEQAREYFRQLCLGLEYLHANEVLHRDIKPENILLSKDRQIVKLCDFGVSELFAASNDDRVRKSGGSPAFLSPETLTKLWDSTSDEAGDGAGFHGKLVDIYALGVTLYCMLTGGLPFNTENPIELFERVQNEDPPIPEDWPPEQKDIVQQMLRKDPSFRMHMFIIREHPWTTEHGAHPMIPRDENLYEVGKFVEEPTQEELSSAIGALRGVFTVIRAVQKMRRLQLHRRSQSSAGSNPASPPARNKQFSTDGESSALSFTSGSMDSYSSEQPTESASVGAGGEAADEIRSKWHDNIEASKSRVASPRRMDSGYADSNDDAEEKEGKNKQSLSSDKPDKEIPHLDLSLSSSGRSRSSDGDSHNPPSPDTTIKRKREMEEGLGKLKISTDVKRAIPSPGGQSARTVTAGSVASSTKTATPSAASSAAPDNAIGIQMTSSPVDGEDDVQAVDSPVDDYDSGSGLEGNGKNLGGTTRDTGGEPDGQWDVVQSPVDEEVSIFASPTEG